MHIHVGDYYRHYKTRDLYKVESVGLHTENAEPLVSYKNVRTNEVFFRPVDIFRAKVMHEGVEVWRFTPQAGNLEPDYIKCLLQDSIESAKELSRRLERICTSLPPWQR